MIHETITLDDAISYLNDLAKRDPEAITRLILMRYPCNRDLAQHPTCQAGTKYYYTIGLLGVINGLFGINDETGWGGILAVLGDDGSVFFRRATADDAS
jgi:hypothetical protein